MPRKRHKWPPPAPPVTTPIQIEHDGKVWKGSYHTEKRSLVVRLAADGSSKSTWISGSSHEESLAGLLLAELVSESQKLRRRE